VQIFEAMLAEKKKNSLYQSWLELGRGWKVFISFIILVVLVYDIIAFGTEKGWEYFYFRKNG